MLDKQIKHNNEAPTQASEEQGPLLLYQDDSSDELENVIDDLLVPGSDSGDNWEDEDDDNEDINDDSDNSIEIVNDVNMSDSD